MNKIGRIITSGVIIALSLWLIVFLGFVDGPKIDLVAIVIGVFFLIIGLYILFNKKEDKIEEIKNKKNN